MTRELAAIPGALLRPDRTFAGQAVYRLPKVLILLLLFLLDVSGERLVQGYYQNAHAKTLAILEVDSRMASGFVSNAPPEAQARMRAQMLDSILGRQSAVMTSIGIALSGQFASWAGGILGIHSQPVLIGETDAQVEEARLRLARVGIEDLRGYLAGGVTAWQKAGLPLVKTAQISPQELNQKLLEGSWRALDVLDVRREGEWQAGHIAEVQCRALDTFPQGLPAIDRERPVAVHCKGGYRSMIACSLLERAGHRNVINVAGGFDAWHAAALPEVAEQLAKA